MKHSNILVKIFQPWSSETEKIIFRSVFVSFLPTFFSDFVFVTIIPPKKNKTHTHPHTHTTKNISKPDHQNWVFLVPEPHRSLAEVKSFFDPLRGDPPSQGCHPPCNSPRWLLTWPTGWPSLESQGGGFPVFFFSEIFCCKRYFFRAMKRYILGVKIWGRCKEKNRITYLRSHWFLFQSWRYIIYIQEDQKISYWSSLPLESPFVGCLSFWDILISSGFNLEVETTSRRPSSLRISIPSAINPKQKLRIYQKYAGNLLSLENLSWTKTAFSQHKPLMIKKQPKKKHATVESNFMQFPFLYMILATPSWWIDTASTVSLSRWIQDFHHHNMAKFSPSRPETPGN